MSEVGSSNNKNTKSNGLILIAALLVFGFVFGGFGLYRYNMGRAKDVLSQHPVGADVPVYYDPADPAQVLLETGIKKNVYIMLGGAFVCFFFAIAIIVSMIRQRNSG